MDFHFDRRADELADKAAQGDPDELLSTSQLSELMKVSCAWLEIGRSRGYGPPFVQLAPRVIRYRRDDLRCWFADRLKQHVSKRVSGSRCKGRA
jgi:hypothetical protein